MSEQRSAVDGGEPRGGWTFLTSHAQALLYIHTHPDTRVRDIVDALEMTERRVYKILGELEQSGYLTREREGRRVRFTINHDLPLRAPPARDISVRQLLDLTNTDH